MVFTVTSNADSGPGTLRDALTQAAANGNATKDYIYFNIADTGRAARTIVLVTQLPDLSSSLVIDATGQPGSLFGVSDARVEISTPRNYDPFVMFNGSNLNDVEFYGLYIHDYYDISISYPDLKERRGINMLNSSNIIFGAANKGNLIKGFNSHCMYLSNVNTITIQNNGLGLTASNDLSEGGSVSLTADISLISCNNILIGGAMNEGNTVFCNITIDFPQKSTGNNVTIKSNNFGVFQDGKTFTFEYQDMDMVDMYTDQLNYGNITPDAPFATANIDIENNVAGCFSNVFNMFALNGNIDFYNNYLGVSRDGSVNLDDNSHPDDGTPIFIHDCPAQVILGGNDPSKKNFCAYSYQAIVATNSNNILVRNNDYECLWFSAYNNDQRAGILPKISITKIDPSNSQKILSGTSDPNAVIDIYSTESCAYVNCSIRSYLQTVIADNNGNWKSDNLTFNGNYYVSATVGNRTSLFVSYQINTQTVKINNIRCNAIASITGLQVPAGLSYHWVDQNGNIVSDQLDLQTTKPGKYQLILGDGCITSDFFEIDDDKVQMDTSGVVKTNISCGVANGSIKNLFVYDPEDKIAKEEWLDAGGKLVGSSTDIDNLGPGKYYFKVFTSDGCESDYGPVTLTNTFGPNIDQSKAAIQSTNCGQSNGAITGIIATGSGTLKYIWWNGQQQTVSTTQDLINQPAGIYKLEITDDSQCGPVYTTDLTIPETNGITMDESKAQTTVASCSNNNGSVSGITVSGATQYKWLDVNNKVAGTSPDLQSIAPGTYTLTASNNFGCTATSKPYTVGQLPPTKFPTYAAVTVSACFQSTDGSVTVATDALVKSVRWVNAGGQNAGSSAALTNIGAGTYQLYLTDQNGCENYYDTYTVAGLPEYKVVSSGAVTNDQCNLGTGSISTADIEGGAAPYTYTWYNASNQQIGTGPAIANLTAGTYTLNVISARCGESNTLYTVVNETTNVAAPLVSNVSLCSSGSAIITVNDPSSSTIYRLYANTTDTQPLAEQKGGRFVVSVTGNTSFYISQLNGTCESSRAEVKVTVGLSALNIANTFTPNGDGINDFWVISGVANYSAAEVQVFTRNGQRVFDSKGYATPFDGTFNGKQLPEGVYYYIIDLKSNCSLLSGSLTIIR